MTDTEYVRLLVQLAWDRTRLSEEDFASLLRAEALAYEEDPIAASDPNRLTGNTTPTAGQFFESTDGTTLTDFTESSP